MAHASGDAREHEASGDAREHEVQLQKYHFLYLKSQSRSHVKGIIHFTNFIVSNLLYETTFPPQADDCQNPCFHYSMRNAFRGKIL